VLTCIPSSFVKTRTSVLISRYHSALQCRHGIIRCFGIVYHRVSTVWTGSRCSLRVPRGRDQLVGVVRLNFTSSIQISASRSVFSLHSTLIYVWLTLTSLGLQRAGRRETTPARLRSSQRVLVVLPFCRFFVFCHPLLTPLQSPLFMDRF
jgi:hypothetical protein